MKENHYVVYQHTNKVNGKKYIGITGRTPEQRWANGRGYKGCSRFEKAINKYGWENFEHEILFNELTVEEAKQKEVDLISILNTRNPNFGYNISPGGDLALSLCAIPVFQLDKNFNVVAAYQSASEAEQKTGISGSHIVKVCKLDSGHVTAGGYAWCYQREYDELDKNYFTQKIKNSRFQPIVRLSPDVQYICEYPSVLVAAESLGYSYNAFRSNIMNRTYLTAGSIWVWKKDYDLMLSGVVPFPEPFKNNHYRAVKQFSTELDFITEYPTIAEANAATNISQSGISACCKGLQKTSGGYKWCYAEDEDKLLAGMSLIVEDHPTPVVQYDLDMNLIATYPSILSAAETNNFNYMNIKRVCDNNRKSAHNFLWRYENTTKEEST